MSFNSFTYNGLNSFTDCGLYIEQRPAPVRPARDGQFISVPGRSGDVYIDGGKYNNVSIKYNVGCSDIKTYMPIINKMLNVTGYNNLSDTYDADYYRMAMCVNSVEFQEDLLNFGHAVIEFNCEPFRYLKSGDTTIIGNQLNQTVINPTNFEALPVIRLTGTAGETCALYIDNTQFFFKQKYAYMHIDSENCLFYNQAKTGVITDCTGSWLSDRFPVLKPGNNKIIVIGNITDVRIIPRWRAL